MSDMLAIGYTGLRAYQTALGTTSENIANAGVAGYSRRSVRMAEVGRTESIAMGQTTKLVGDGVLITGTFRAEDAFRSAEVRRASTDLSRTNTAISWLDRIEGSLANSELGKRLTAFFNAAKGVAADPAASAPRSVMLESATSLAAAFAGTARALGNDYTELETAGRDAATQLTSATQSMLMVNRGLARADVGSTERLSLLDQRDKLLETMAGLTDISVSTDGLGRATVRAGGTGGPVLVDGNSAGSIGFAANTAGEMEFSVSREAVTSRIASNGGTMAGIADSARRLADTREKIDSLATDFVDAVNTVQAAGRDLDGNPGAPMFALGTPPADMTMVLGAGRGIAAAAPGEGTRGNGNLADLAAVRQSAGFEGRLDDLVIDTGATLSAKQSVAGAQTSIRDAAVSARDSVSGVDLDEEAVNLIRFQQAYQASSRVIQVARETLDMIFAIR